MGRGVGTNALGAINLVNPFVLIVNAMNLFISVGGVAICAVHMGKGDYEGANTVFRHGMLLLPCTAAVLSFAGSSMITILTVLLRENICLLFGSNGETAEYVLQIYPIFSIGFIIMAINVMITAYLYSTERSALSTGISLLRSVILNSAIIVFLPKLFGNGAIWLSMFTYEAVVLVIAVILLKYSERNGVRFK